MPRDVYYPADRFHPRRPLVPRTHTRSLLLAFLLTTAPVVGLGGCSQADNPQIPQVATPAPPQDSKPLPIPKRGGETYGASSKYQEIMNKKDQKEQR